MQFPRSASCAAPDLEGAIELANFQPNFARASIRQVQSPPLLPVSRVRYAPMFSHSMRSSEVSLSSVRLKRGACQPFWEHPSWPLARGSFLSPPRRGGPLGPGWVVPFLRCRRAAATALTAAVMTLMSVGGIALTSDHTHLTYQRDILKAGTDAATLATTRHMWTLDQDSSAQAINDELMPIAKRYILANIPKRKRQQVADTLTVTLTPDRTAGTVDIVAKADLGGIVFGSWLYGNMVSSTQVDSLSDFYSEDGTPSEDDKKAQKALGTPTTELVLAIDTTASMGLRACRGATAQKLKS